MSPPSTTSTHLHPQQAPPTPNTSPRPWVTHLQQRDQGRDGPTLGDALPAGGVTSQVAEGGSHHCTEHGVPAAAAAAAACATAGAAAALQARKKEREDR